MVEIPSIDVDTQPIFAQNELTREEPSGYFYYLNSEARRNLKNYQYRGSDNSLLYKYVLSPLAQFCVEKFIPITMAPNVITLLGLIWMVTSYLVCWWYSPDLEPNENIPRWIFLWLAISLLGYQTLDNMDGKQARRSNSSSPLGLLFDHGCDSVNSILGSAGLIVALGITIHDNPIPVAAAILAPFAAFYVSTWEEYHIGELILPIVNGPSDGVFLNAMMHLLTFAKGTQVWHGTEMFDFMKDYIPSNLLPDGPLRNLDIFSYQLILATLNEIVFKIFAVTRKHKGSYKNLIPFVVMVSGLCTIAWYAPDIFLASPRTALHFATVLFVEMTTSLMLDHMTCQTFQWLRWQQMPLVGIVLALTYFQVDHNVISYWVTAYTWSLGAYLVMKTVLVIQECCTVLNIWCFDIVTPRTKKLT